MGSEAQKEGEVLRSDTPMGGMAHTLLKISGVRSSEAVQRGSKTIIRVCADDAGVQMAVRNQLTEVLAQRMIELEFTLSTEA